MLEDNTDLSRQAETLLRRHSVGFLRLDPSRGSSSAGSGALVRIDRHRGILTAGHVLSLLENLEQEVGLVHFPERRKFQSHRIDMQKQICVFEGKNTENSQTGPDMAFLRLNDTDASSIEARDLIFFDLMRDRGGRREGERILRSIVGVVHEATTRVPTSPDIHTNSYTALVGVGTIRNEYQHQGYDFIDFEISHGEEVPEPGSYVGMSGGALWRMIINDRSEVRLDGIQGIAFYETPATGPRRLICHGPKSVYDVLVPKVRHS
jgi:hypothetical protein